MRHLFFFFIVIAFSLNAKSHSTGESTRSARTKAMGGVALPFVRGVDALFVNPASLGKHEDIQLRLGGVGVGVNQQAIDSKDDFSNLDANDPTTFDPLYGKKMQAQLYLQAGLAIKGLAMGYSREVYASAELHNPVQPKFETYARMDEAYYLGGGFDLGGGTYLGIAFKRIHRQGGDTLELDVSDIAGSGNLDDITRRFENKGQAYGVDLGVMKEIESHPLKPVFTVVWQDIGDSAFQHQGGLDAPSRIRSNLMAGVGVSAEATGFSWQAGGELRHLLDSDLDLGKKVFLGTEIGLGPINVRGGYSQGYFVYGAGIDFKFIQIDAVRYTEEMGTYPGQAGDARYMVSLNIDLSFDANFNIADNRRSKLKQRR